VVILTGKQQFRFFFCQRLFQLIDLSDNLIHERTIVHLRKRFQVLDICGERLPFFHNPGEFGDAFHDLLGAIRIIPKIGVFCVRLEIL
jgi:hypothetical protein